MRCRPRSFAAPLTIVLGAATLAACSDEGPVQTDPVDADAILAVSRANVGLSAVEDTTDPATATVEVTNAADGSIGGLEARVSYGDGGTGDWLTPSFDRSSTPAVLTISAFAVRAAVGANTATVTIASGEASNDSVTVEVEFIVEALPPADLVVAEAPTVTPDAVAAGDTIAFSSWTVANQGGRGAGDVAIGSYLSTDSTITADDTPVFDNVDSLFISGGTEVDRDGGELAIPAGTAPGSYYFGVLVDELDAVEEADETNNFRSVPLTVVEPEPAPSIVLSKSTVGFEAVEGGPEPADESVSITNGGGETLDGLGATVAYADGQPTGWLTASLDATTAPATLTLGATTGSLTEGSYDAAVDVTSDVADNSPRTVTVTVDIQRQGDPATLRDVVVNEVNWFGNGAETTDEWIELRNLSGDELDLSGWTIDAAGPAGDPVTLDDGTVLGPGEYLVIGAKQGADVDGERTSLTGIANVRIQPVSLSNTGEQLVLRDVEGTLIDSTPSGGWPAGDDTDLWSMERYDDITGGGYTAGDDAGAWYTWISGSTDTTHPDTNDSGTPGADNSDPS